MPVAGPAYFPLPPIRLKRSKYPPSGLVVGGARSEDRPISKTGQLDEYTMRDTMTEAWLAYFCSPRVIAPPELNYPKITSK